MGAFCRLAGLRLLIVLAIVAQSPFTAFAQGPLRAVQVASGLTQPLGFVQDPGDPAIQYIVQQDGHIRVLQNGALRADGNGPIDFLDVTGAIATEGEQGLLGLAFPTDYASSGRFFVYFTDTNGDVVIARYRRSTGNPLVADASSRFDLRWSTGNRFIEHSSNTNHNGGHVAFGPDGYLYAAVGDGGGGGDPDRNAQNPASLLGKILRIDVSVTDGHPDGFVVPASNPFVGIAGRRPEIWALGLRNPWKFAFDRGTGALVIADVGQAAWEEIDYQPGGQGGRNYGWSRYEGSHDFNTSVPLGPGVLSGPIFEYDHTVGRSITGGFVYRGQALGPGYIGRYFFGDFITRRIWSIALSIDPGSGEAVGVSDLREHTAELGGHSVSAFGEDASGELYVVDYSGQVLRMAPPSPILTLDTVAPRSGHTEVAGWTIDPGALVNSGMDAVHVYAFPDSSGPFATPPIFLGAADAPFQARPDVAALYGQQFRNSGFRIFSTRWYPPGPVLFAAHARSILTGSFQTVSTAFFPYADGGQFAHAVDQAPSGSVRQPFSISGWALDYFSSTAPSQVGTGIARASVDIISTTSGAHVLTTDLGYGASRPDVGAIFGARFAPSGFAARIQDLAPGQYAYRLRFPRTAGGAEFSTPLTPFSVLPGPMLAIGIPAPGQNVAATFLIGGWALDLRAGSGPGVDAIHVWAYRNPGSGTPPQFLGVATYGVPRPDVAAILGAQFTNCGFNLVAGPLAADTYDVVVFARSVITGTFEIHRIVRVTVT